MFQPCRPCMQKAMFAIVFLHFKGIRRRYPEIVDINPEKKQQIMKRRYSSSPKLKNVSSLHSVHKSKKKWLQFLGTKHKGNSLYYNQNYWRNSRFWSLYSVDLAPSDHFLFLYLEQSLGEQRFVTDKNYLWKESYVKDYV